MWRFIRARLMCSLSRERRGGEGREMNGMGWDGESLGERGLWVKKDFE